MNRHIASILAVTAAAFAGNALADDITIDTTPFASAKSRVEVQAELGQYKRAGVNPWSTQYNPLKQFKSATTREQVVAEYIAARDEVAALNGEDSGSAYLAQGHGRNLDASTTLARAAR
jgi:coproporphyrinogen III oxidase-like Fe-S oxidoreductase